MLAVMDEFSILKKLQDGDKQAWGEEFPRLWKIAFAAARLRGLPNEEDIEDAAITAIQKVIERIAGIKSIDGIDKLLWSISKKRAIDLIRKKDAVKRGGKGNRPEQIGPENDGTILIPDGKPLEIEAPAMACGKTNALELISHLPDCLCNLDLKELREILKEITDLLPEPGRSIWQDYHWHDLSYEELGKKYGKTSGAIRTLVFRTQAKLRVIIFKSPDFVKHLREFLR